MTATGPGPDGVGQPELDGVTGPDGDPEVIGAEVADPATVRARAWLRVRPRLLVGLVGLAAIGAVAGLTMAVREGVRQAQGPQLPGLAVTALKNRPDVTVWVTSQNGRPEGPLVLSMLVTLQLAQPTDVDVSVLGLSGPGEVGAENDPSPIPTGMRQWTADLRATLDCDRLPANPTATDYRLRLAVRAGSRTVERRAPVGSAGGQWITSVQDACASWQARRHLTVTAVAGVVDPTRTRTTLTLVVTNTGHEPALVGPVLTCCGEVSVEPAEPLRVPPLSAASAAFSVLLDSCDTVASRAADAPPSTEPRLSLEIGLAALAGPHLPPDLTGFDQPVDPTLDGFGPTGMVIGGDAAARLDEALSQACGGLGPSGVFPGAGRARFDARSGLLTLPVTIDVTPGRVRSLRLVTEPSSSLSQEYRPLETTIGPLVPDRTGRVRTVLRYRVADGCLLPDALIPGFTMVLAVPDGGKVREVHHHGGDFALEQFPELRAQFCRH